jgi:glycosyltransferase involved in cell wall biosynthesis
VRILVIAPFAPRTDARHGGGRALAATIGALAERNEVALAYLHDPDGVDEPMRRSLAFVEELPAPQASGIRHALVYPSLLRGVPVAVAERIGERATDRLRTILGRWRPDLVQFEFLITTALVPALTPSTPRLLVDHDSTLRPIESFRHLPPLVRRPLRRLDDRAWTQLAGRAARTIEIAVVFTERDRRSRDSALFHNVHVVPLLVPARAAPMDAVGAAPPSVLFTGYYRHPPNADAAGWLVDEIFPRVRARHPDARLLLVGAELPESIASRAGDGIDVVGGVEDVQPYLDRAAVVAAPLRTGGGTRVKVLEALGAGKAVVATPLAADGIDAPHGEAIVVASSSDQLADEIAALLADPSRRARIGAAAYAWASTALDARRTAEHFERIYEALTAG